MFRAVIWTFILFLIVQVIKAAPKVEIVQGIVQGTYRQTWNGRTINAFYGIPYAEPPIGNLRFKPPVPAKPWARILYATRPSQMCPQFDMLTNNYEVQGQEDCLYINVYTPELPVFNNAHLPVMVFIHGGALVSGSGSPDLYGPDVLLDRDVVLVTLNYRLGALGFLSTGDENVPGNNGLKDQVMALKWTKDNIESFGGDPSNIMIFGQSAGGLSVHYHMFSPLSRDLFHKAIAHSGTAFAPWSKVATQETIKNGKQLATFLKCPNNSSSEMVECLQSIEVFHIIEQDKQFMKWHYDPVIPFRPVIEANPTGAFLSAHPVDIIKSGKVANVPFITGITTEDGAIKSAAVYNSSKLVNEINKDFNKIIPLIVQYNETIPDKDAVSNKIRDFYFGSHEIDNAMKSQFTNFITDSLFAYPQSYLIHLHKKYSKGAIYSFVFGYRGSISMGPLFGDPNHNYGVCHGDELNYLLSTSSNFKPTKSDKRISEILVTLWTNFANHSDPTPDVNDLIKTKWTPVQGEDISSYFIENENKIEMVDNLYSERIQFWESLALNACSGIIPSIVTGLCLTLTFLHYRLTLT